MCKENCMNNDNSDYVQDSQHVINAEEIERKWLVKELPDIEMEKGEQIIQGYIVVDSKGKEVRVRRKGDKYYETIKSGGGLIRQEIEIELIEDQFNRLWEATGEWRVKKTRYIIPYNEFRIELDIYHDSLMNLIIAEVEFNTIEQSNSFIPAEWFDAEVTCDQRYKNKNLAIYGIPTKS